MNRNEKLEEEIWDSLYLQIFFLVKKNQWSWQSIGAILGLGGGAASFILTILLQTINWLLQDNLVLLLKEIDFVSLVIVLPLLAFGAHCLDLLEKESAEFQNVRLPFSNWKPGFEVQNAKIQ